MYAWINLDQSYSLLILMVSKCLKYVLFIFAINQNCQKTNNKLLKICKDDAFKNAQRFTETVKKWQNSVHVVKNTAD